MSKDKDPNYVVKVEKAIADKYGEETIQNPRSNWSDEKEKEYLSQLKDIYYSESDDGFVDEEQVNGVFIPKKLLNRESNRSCPVCKTYSFKSNDDVYMTKFDCCEKCYIQWVEGREERWLKGWRPNNG
jgi:phage FluMu gp28-like protein